MAKLLFSEVEKELGKLKTEEIIPYFKDFIQTVPGSDPVEVSANPNVKSDTPKIKQLEQEVEVLKIKQKNKLELPLSKLEAVRGEAGIDEQTESGKVDNLQMLLRRDFRITGMVSPQRR